MSLVNVFGSWCVACRIEHPFLMKLKHDRAVADLRHRLAGEGPPSRAGLARRSTAIPTRWSATIRTAAPPIAFGVTGAPETFVVDAKGIIRYKQTGPITPEVWEQTLWPIVRRLQAG